MKEETKEGLRRLCDRGKREKKKRIGRRGEDDDGRGVLEGKESREVREGKRERESKVVRSKRKCEEERLMRGEHKEKARKM